MVTATEMQLWVVYYFLPSHKLIKTRKTMLKFDYFRVAHHISGKVKGFTYLYLLTIKTLILIYDKYAQVNRNRK